MTVATIIKTGNDMGLLHTDMTLCTGKGCTIKESCDRYLAGNKFKGDGIPHWWMDSCGEDRDGYINE